MKSTAAMSHEEMGYAHRNTIPMPKLPRPLTHDEKKYLLAVDRADVATVKRMINQALAGDSVLNIDCVDALGRGALLMAIEAENIDMVQTLVVLGVRTGDALLHAIQNQFVEAVELLLEHEELVHKEGQPYSWESVDRDTANFTTDITPLLLASHTNNYEILKILLDRGATIPMPHDIRCSCNECTEGVRQDSLRYSASRINAYKALASSSLIALTSVDPLLTAFELSWELKQLGTTEYEFRQEYQELRKNTQEFSVKLLGHVRTSKELQTMLDYDPTVVFDEDGVSSTEGRSEYGLARLRLAINYKQKKFVAHPWVQQLLASMWYDGLPGFRQKSSFSKALEIVRIITFSPFYCLVYMFAPRSESGRLMRKPFMKFLTHAASYLFFLLLLILVSQRAEERFTDFLKFNLQTPGEKATEAPPMRKQHRGNFPQYLEYMVVFYVIGFVIEETRELLKDGLKAYVSNMWNIIDFLRNGLYCIVALLRVWALLEQLEEIKIDPERAYIPREDWTDFDPQLIAEGLFAAANIVSALKLVQLSTINPHLGPLQISLGRMVFDILKFFFFYTLVLFAFASGLNQLLWYFADLERQKCYSLPDGLPDWKNSPEACMRWRRFGSLFESSQSLFWASFGMIGLDDFELSGIKSYTRFWGLLMFGSYCVINVIVLLNLLIAMLSNTYAEIAQRADTEWKFARTKLWLSYFDEDATLPSPFNIVPRPKQLTRLILRYVPFKEMKAAAESVKARHLDLKEQGLQYTAVMRALVWRYVSGMQRKSEEEPISTDDINEVKGEISALRYDLKELFAQNGMTVQPLLNRQNTGAKKSREWERRLMSGFHVAPAAGDASVNEMAKETCLLTDVGQKSGETGAARFRRMARLAILNRERLNRPPKHLCHIGRSTSDDSLRSRQSLKRAMDEVQRAKAHQVAPPPKASLPLVDKLHQNSIEIEAPVLTPALVLPKMDVRTSKEASIAPRLITVATSKSTPATTSIVIPEVAEDSQLEAIQPASSFAEVAKLVDKSPSSEPPRNSKGPPEQEILPKSAPKSEAMAAEADTPKLKKTAPAAPSTEGTENVSNLTPASAQVSSTREQPQPTPTLSPRLVPTTVKRGWF